MVLNVEKIVVVMLIVLGEGFLAIYGALKHTDEVCVSGEWELCTPQVPVLLLEYKENWRFGERYFFLFVCFCYFFPSW